MGQLEQQASARLSGTEETWKSLQLFDLVLGLFYVYEYSACTSVPGALRGKEGVGSPWSWSHGWRPESSARTNANLRALSPALLGLVLKREVRVRTPDFLVRWKELKL